MKLPRLSIGDALAVVVGCATTFAGFRALLGYGTDSPTVEGLALGLPLIVFALQMGLYRAVFSRGRSRTFWAGFVAFGLLSVGTYAAAFLGLPDSMKTPLIVWGLYYELAAGGLMVVLAQWLGSPFTLVWAIAAAVVLFLPHLLVAWAGGRLSCSLAARLRGRSRPIQVMADLAQ
jgi:hypothetical protein